MSTKPLHQCECPECAQPGESPTKALHRRMNLFCQCLDERQRRLYAAVEAKKLGRGGQQLLALITGLHVQTIRRGLRELDHLPAANNGDRVRQPGGGRSPVEKKIPLC